MHLKILSYNIHKGFDILNRRFVLRQIKAQIHHLQPDIVCLQEVLGEHQGHRKKVQEYPIETQFEFLADTVWPHHAYGKNAVYSQGHHGNAILSKFPIKRWNNLDLSLDKSEMRGLLHAEIELPGENRTFDVFTTHMNLFHKARMRQANLIADYINHKIAPEKGFVLVGDFNDWLCELDPFLRERLALKELFLELYGKHARTFPAFYPKLPLDRAYVRHARSIQGMVLREGPWDDLSDHLPIYVEIDA